MTLLACLAAAGTMVLFRRFLARWRLSRAKHPSLTGHARLSQRLAKLLPYYGYSAEEFFCSDGAPIDIADQRRSGFRRLAQLLQERAPETIRRSADLEQTLSDLQFINAYRVPFQYRRYAQEHLKVGALVEQSSGVFVRDLDGNVAYDLSGAYGANLFGYDFYKDCIRTAVERVDDLGPVLGPYHPIVEENVRMLRDISGLDEVSFHMSGTEAVMQAVRLARYYTRRSHLVRFCGAYHGWWDGVQPGVGNPRPVRDVYTLAEMSEDSLRVLRTRNDIACVLINPLQALHPNALAPSDGALIGSDRRAAFNRAAYSRWLEQVREVCSARSIVLIIDEVFVGFRIAYGGAQEYFGVAADMVTYGKTVGGGLPVGVVCGRAHLMRRFNDDRPSDICFARGTFNSHPYVMATMNEFLRRLHTPAIRRTYSALDCTWDARAADLNAALADESLPVRVANLVSIWTIWYPEPSRYNWMFQYYLRAEGLALSWVGSGRLIFSHRYADADWDAVRSRFVAAATRMRDDGWWWRHPSLTNRAIKRQILGEVLSAWLFPRDKGSRYVGSTPATGSNSSPRKRYAGDL